MSNVKVVKVDNLKLSGGGTKKVKRIHLKMLNIYRIL